jgi:hypothetical protein
MLFDIESLPSGLTIEEIGSFPPSLEVKTEKEWMEYRKSGSNVPIKSNGIFFKEGWDPMLRSLRAAPSIVERAEHILGSRRPIGVHIRRTDNKKSIEYSPSRLFWETMETYPNDVFFLASDSEEDRQEAYRRFPGRIITAGTLVPRYAPLGTYYAMLDLYCLSRCSQILGSYYSSFTEIAAAWGGIPLRVVRLPL